MANTVVTAHAFNQKVADHICFNHFAFTTNIKCLPRLRGGRRYYSPIWPIRGRTLDKGIVFGPAALNKVYKLSEFVLIKVWIRPRQGMAARLWSSI